MVGSSAFRIRCHLPTCASGLPGISLRNVDALVESNCARDSTVVEILCESPLTDNGSVEPKHPTELGTEVRKETMLESSSAGREWAGDRT